MNNRTKCYQKMQQLADRLGLPMTDLLDVQADLIQDFLDSLNVPYPVYDPEELELLKRTAEFRVYVSQVWANRDRELLKKINIWSDNWFLQGQPAQNWYWVMHSETLRKWEPNDTVVQAFKRELYKMDQTFLSFQQLLNAA